ncbi:MAG: NAD-dependent epimerase/dehydratase family protein [Nevskia sp.]|nr:NAD-dependent epimerase/dehydratase family protein [Nevskia sp.]
MNGICLVGAGVISQSHAAALRSLGRRVVAVVDPDAAAAQRLAQATGAAAHASVAAALAAGGFDRAHVLVPPPAHGETALALLGAGIHVLAEKPLAVSSVECADLLGAARRGGAQLGVNQNFVHHPAFVRLRRKVESGALGRPRFVSCLYNVALRQLQARQFGHWMFREPGNILLEQAVHPLSQVAILAGPIRQFRALAGPATEIAPGVPFVPEVTLTLEGETLPAQLRFAVGQSFPFWQVTVVCDDGVIIADILANRVATHGHTGWLEPVDALLSGLALAAGAAGDSVANAARYAAATLHLTGRGDPFFRSMRASIAAFHEAVDHGRAPALDGTFGAGLVGLCETIRDQAFPTAVPAPVAAAPLEAAPVHVAVLGGTGFIGTHVVRQLLGAGLHVSVMARNLQNLPAVFADPRVVLHQGDIRDKTAVAAAIAGAPVVVNLAHGGGGGGYEAVRDAMLGGAETVARACRAAGVRRLVHVGSIAALYLGPQEVAVTGATPPDPQAETRADYARVKAECDRRLLALHAAEGLPVVILRPGLVVGEGTAPLHSGLGFCNTEQHCIGWNGGGNPLPFVLVDDVAAAVLGAIRAEGIEGRCYNLVGDVRPNARTYVAALAEALRRPLRYHPQWPAWLWLEDVGKWTIKRLTGRQVPMPSRRDFLSRGMQATFDCTDAKRDLGWRPEADTARFFARAVRVYAS